MGLTYIYFQWSWVRACGLELARITVNLTIQRTPSKLRVARLISTTNVPEHMVYVSMLNHYGCTALYRGVYEQSVIVCW